ncbi:MAG: aminopeptidase [Desulfobacca sp. 4484_104]|nr:MAG: aminopeptidase [Desulfobacca sp. 4484_104]RLA86808.1 MAG: aminopeptidase [Deltaproteobacteria bacterium]
METPSKDEIQQLRDKLAVKPRLVWDRLDAAERAAVLAYAERYKHFLDVAKTERQAVVEIQRQAQERGFVDLGSDRPGSRFYLNYRGKTIALVVLGKQPVSAGLRIIAAHIDSPRLDLKQYPIYEEGDLTFLKTHYYGGIKKYQWLARPLALHGVILKANGETVNLRVGEEDSDPVFTVCDLLPHLARKVQMDKKVDEAFIGEKLNLLAGSLPYGNDDTKERFKLHLLNLLSEQYGLQEEDLVSAELEVVPAGRARDLGWDRSLIGGYGQDDRACAYAALEAIFKVQEPPYTCLALFVDKEEVGSDGNTSAKSCLLEELVTQLLERQGEGRQGRRAALMGSKAISADVNGALDPDWPEVHEKHNAARLGYGVCITKFTGHGGKYLTNDAHAEYVGWIRRLFNRQSVVWQAGELGKVDEGGGGTIAKFLAIQGMDIIDCGTPVLSMHSPFEVASKGDLYMTYKAYRGFFADDQE